MWEVDMKDMHVKVLYIGCALALAITIAYGCVTLVTVNTTVVVELPCEFGPEECRGMAIWAKTCEGYDDARKAHCEAFLARRRVYLLDGGMSEEGK